MFQPRALASAIPQKNQLLFWWFGESEKGFITTVETLKAWRICHEIEFWAVSKVLPDCYMIAHVAERRLRQTTGKREAYVASLQPILRNHNTASWDLFSAEYQLQHCKQQSPAIWKILILSVTANCRHDLPR